MPLDTLLAIFPQLAASNPRITSPPTMEYNCLSWAVGDTARWWQPWGVILPAPPPEYQWPAHLPHDQTVNTYALFLADHRFEPCANGDLEPDLEKVAIYTRDGEVTHATRQLASGRWTSKAGVTEDFEHDLESLSGRENQYSFGEPTHFFSRPRF